jgi:hypothetical protein
MFSISAGLTFSPIQVAFERLVARQVGDDLALLQRLGLHVHRFCIERHHAHSLVHCTAP